MTPNRDWERALAPQQSTRGPRADAPQNPYLEAAADCYKAASDLVQPRS